MEKITCFIADDEPLALQLIQSYIAKTPFLELTGTFSNAFDLLDKVATNKPDLIFLDIQMPDLTGIELSRTLSKDIKIIFTTAFGQYALDGFKVDALDYLVKPFDYTEFLKAAVKAQGWFTLRNTPNTAAVITAEPSFIFVKSEYRQIRIDLSDVYYFEGLKDYVKIWLGTQPEKPILTLMSLKALEESLPVNKFMRIHRSFIIALDKIKVIERSQILILNERITLADQYKDKFQQFISSKSIH